MVQSSILNPQSPRISIIVAMAKNRVIGAGNRLPWHLSSDLKRFKALTMGHHIIMGRKTFESIGRILPGRTSIVVTRNPGYRPAGVLTAGNLDAALELAAGDSEVFVIGGEQIFSAALPKARRIYLTELDREFPGDVFFPPLAPEQWNETAEEHLHDAGSGLDYSNKTLERKVASR
jgi:dihydrofolate reductase